MADICLRQGCFSLQASVGFNGSALGVFGPSGSGKSTFMRALAGLDQPDCGRIELGGDVFYDSSKHIWVPPHERHVGIVFQDARLFPHWSTDRNLRAGIQYSESGLFSFDHLVDLLEIEPLLGRPVQNLSGGEQQRVALGRALLAHPRLLLLDEPVSGLDAGLKKQILPFLKRVHEELHLPCILVSHDLPEILQLTNQLVLMSGGQVMAQGALSELVENKEAFERLRSSGLMSTLALPCGSVGVRPDEVILADRPVEGLSAQHCLQGELRRLIDHGNTVICMVDTSAGRLMADVTPAAVQQLHFSVGRPIWCIFKTYALYPAA